LIKPIYYGFGIRMIWIWVKNWIVHAWIEITRFFPLVQQVDDYGSLNNPTKELCPQDKTPDMANPLMSIISDSSHSKSCM